MIFRRHNIAQATMENQDEPFNALDYKTCNDIKESIERKSYRLRLQNEDAARCENADSG